MDGIGTNHVLYLRAGITSSSDGPLWSAETWYTLNAFGTGEPFTNPVSLQEAATPSHGSGKWVVTQGPGRIGIEVPFDVAWTFELRKPRGSLSGVVLLSVHSKREVISRLITLP